MGRGWLTRWLSSRAHAADSFSFSNGIAVDEDEIRTGNAVMLDPYDRILAATEDDLVIADLDALYWPTAAAAKGAARRDRYTFSPTLRNRSTNGRTTPALSLAFWFGKTSS